MLTELFFYCLLYKVSYLAATAMATATAKTMLKVDENVNLRLERNVNRPLFYCLLYTVSYLAATAMATAMLKMDENVNLRLQRHVNVNYTENRYIGHQQVCRVPHPNPLSFCTFAFLRTGYFLYLGHISRHYSDQLFLPYCCVQGVPT